MRQFLWKGTALGRGGAKVAWEDVCLPKTEGGLGIRNLKDCNKALMEFLLRWGISLLELSLNIDRFTWCGHPSSSFSVSSAWNLIRARKILVNWAPLIWDNAIAPRYQFILWLIVKNRLPTQVMLLSYGRIGFNVCAFCSEVPDSRDHLFFGCRISASLAFFWAARCNLPWRNRCWNEVLSWARKFLTGNDFYHRIVRFSFGALCHLIWKKMNAIIFTGESLVVPALKNHLIKVVRDKAITFKNVSPSPRNKRLQRGWGFDPVVFLSGSDP
ncbi:uncharacterized protein LOC120292531 [Eucalyptus grandis]|uniref:uncharacterized protein LOC120292531 n=1 Tax=Eucalyptus grandis TaxID=71139 RepID=UPI00192EBBA0|nr:uncharacterized protein LOC120292531 [Eucalyptus grandis]